MLRNLQLIPMVCLPLSLSIANLPIMEIDAIQELIDTYSECKEENGDQSRTSLKPSGLDPAPGKYFYNKF